VIPPPASALYPGLGRFEVFDVAPERAPALGTHLVCTTLPWSAHAPPVRQRPDQIPARDLATYRERWHVPLHPALDPADGWVDLARAVAAPLAARPDCALIFEYAWGGGVERGGGAPLGRGSDPASPRRLTRPGHVTAEEPGVSRRAGRSARTRAPRP
jgi:hypothetical protein